MVVALIALLLSTTGIADAARRAVISTFAGHPVSTKPHAGGVLLLGKNRKFPAAAIPTVKNADEVGGKTAAQLEGTCPPDTVDIGSWCLETAPYSLPNSDVGKNNFIFASKTCEAAGGWLPSASELLGAAARVKLESTIHDSPADRHDPPGPDPGSDGRARDELDARHDRSGLAGRRLRGRQRRLDRQSSPGPGQPAPGTGQSAARIAAVRDRLRQRQRRAASPAPSR